MEKTITLIDAIEKYKPSFIEMLDGWCNIYKVVGMGSYESPMWMQYAGTSNEEDDNYLKFQSSQCAIKYIVPIEREDMAVFYRTDYYKLYDIFRTLKYNHIRDNHPTVYKEIRK